MVISFEFTTTGPTMMLIESFPLQPYTESVIVNLYMVVAAGVTIGLAMDASFKPEVGVQL